LDRIFETVDEQLSYANDSGFISQRKDLLELYDRFDELARTHLNEKSLGKGLGYFLRAFQHHGQVSSLKEATNAVVNHAEWVFVLEGTRSQASLEQLQAMITKLYPHTKTLESRLQKEVGTTIL
jgi:hypothetical protein